MGPAGAGSPVQQHFACCSGMPGSSLCFAVTTCVAGLREAGQNNLVGAAFEWVGDSPVLAAEPLVGVRECWRLVGAAAVNGGLGTSHDSRRTCCLGWLWPSSPFPSTGVGVWWTSQQ